MIILFVNQYFPPDATNSAYLLGELTEDLAEHHEVWVIAGRPSYNQEAGTQPPAGVRLRYAISTGFGRASMVGRLVNYISFVASALLRALLAPRADLVVTMTDPPIVGAVGYVASLRHRCPFAIICQDVFPDIAVAVGKLRNRGVIAVWTWLNRWLRNRSARVFVVGRDMKQKLEAQGTPAEKLTYIPNWAAIQDGPEKASKIREQMGWKDQFIVMHAGNVGIPQNLPALIDAAYHLRNERDVLIVVLGDGAMKTELQRRTAGLHLENVVFLSHRPKDEAQALMAAAGVHVVSLAPGLWGCAAPSKMYGIMTTGRPIIAAVEEGSEPALLVAEARCGIRVEPGDVRALAEAIMQIKDEAPEDIGRRGRDLLRQRYMREMITARYRQELEELRRR